MTHQIHSLGTPLTVLGSHPECLPEIFRDDVNLVIWDRRPDPAWHPFVETFTQQAGELERFISLGSTDTAIDVLPQWARAIEGVDDWLKDVDGLVEMYRCLFEPEAIGLRLHVLKGTMCPRFHVDRVPVRLLCTYQGTGTEWLPESAVTRPGREGPLPEQQVAPVRVRQLSAGSVSLLKGESWIGNEGKGVVHRSPPPGEVPRLVVGLDRLSSQ